MSSLAGLIDDHSVLICCGAGGVGKTTTAAALALAVADGGRRACVVTIDPARRLADALGAADVANEPTRLNGPWSGELWAVMLDASGTFDDLVRRYSSGPEQTERILANRIYRNLTSALSGTQEFMATEKLYELVGTGDFDVVVVDTPPSRHALDFLDAPRRLTHFLENRIFRVLLMPTRAYMRALSVATQTLLRTISRVAGSEIVEDAVAFFQAFEGMDVGFRERAVHVDELLQSESTAFVLVAAPRRDAVQDAHFFAERLAASGHAVDALVVNRLSPAFGDGDDSGVLGESDDGRGHDAGGDGAGGDGAGGDDAWVQLWRNLAELNALAEREADVYAELVERIAPAPVAGVPLLEVDVHDLAGLAEIARYLVSEPVAFGGGQDLPRQ